MRGYRKFKKRFKVLHIFIVSIAVVLLWRGLWGLMDTYFFPGNEALSYILSVIVAFAILYFDDFHLKELE